MGVRAANVANQTGGTCGQLGMPLIPTGQADLKLAGSAVDQAEIVTQAIPNVLYLISADTWFRQRFSEQIQIIHGIFA